MFTSLSQRFRKSAWPYIFLSGQGASCHVNMAADKTLELGRVNDLAFNTPANNMIQIVHYLQADIKRLLQAFAHPCLS